MPSSTESLAFQKEKIGGRKNKRKQDALCQSLLINVSPREIHNFPVSIEAQAQRG